MKCPKCQGEMEEGMPVDQGSWGTLMPQQQDWQKGKEVNIPIGKPNYKIRSYRCTNCGYLESYAK